MSIALTGEGVEVNLVRIEEEGADLELYSCSQKLVRSDTGNRLAERFCLGGYADCGRDPDMGVEDGGWKANKALSAGKERPFVRHD